MANLQELKRQHQVFAKEVFAFLLNNCKVGCRFLTECEILRPYIGDAIVTISNVFRKDYSKIFSRLRQNLNHVKTFEDYCMIVPVKKDKRYFYHILARISIIFELSVYCYTEGFDYFRSGQKCVANFADLQFFETAGGWERLGHTSLFIASIGRPMSLIMSQQYNDDGEQILTFDEAFDAVYKYFTFTGNISMLDSAEMHCLKQLNETFQVRAPKDKDKCARKVKSRKDTESTKYHKTSSRADVADVNEPNQDLLLEYFKKCLSDLLSSKAFGYSAQNLDEGNKSNVSYLGTVAEHKNSTVLVGSRGHQNLAFDLKRSFSDKKVNYIENCNTSYPKASIRSSLHSSGKGKQTTIIEASEEVSLIEMIHSYARRPERTSNISEINLTPILKDASLKYTDSVPTDIYRVSSGKVLSEIKTGKLDERYQNAENYKYDENSFAQKEFSVRQNLIVPKKYLNFRKSPSSNQSMHLYSVKMFPPSAREKVTEPIKTLLDDNIENQNYDILPSGDILVCPRVPPSQIVDTLVIFAESSSDDEVEADLDTLMCLFKKMEIDSKSNRSCYSLRSRQHKSLEKVFSSSDINGDETIMGNTMAFDKGTPPMVSRRVKRKRFDSDRYEAFPNEKLVKLYRRHFTSFLDVYFNTRFSVLATGVKKGKSTQANKSYCKHVFVVTARIMAKRKVLLDEPDEKKPILAAKMNDRKFLPQQLSLDVQRALDSQIRRHNYFFTSKGVYGVGPARSVTEENIWMILLSGDGKFDSLKITMEDLRDMPKTFFSCEPVLEIFMPLPVEIIKADMQRFKSVIYVMMRDGFKAFLKRYNSLKASSHSQQQS